MTILFFLVCISCTDEFTPLQKERMDAMWFEYRSLSTRSPSTPSPTPSSTPSPTPLPTSSPTPGVQLLPTKSPSLLTESPITDVSEVFHLCMLYML